MENTFGKVPNTIKNIVLNIKDENVNITFEQSDYYAKIWFREFTDKMAFQNHFFVCGNIKGYFSFCNKIFFFQKNDE